MCDYQALLDGQLKSLLNEGKLTLSKDELNDIYENLQKSLYIKVTGSEFNLSFPASFAESLVEVQRNFYKLVAYALHGRDSIKSLSKDELANYHLVFHIQQGSTEIFGELVNLPEFLTVLTEGMSPEQKMFFSIIIVAILAGAWVWTKHIQGEQEVKVKEIDSKNLEQLLNTVAAVSNDAQETARKAIRLAEKKDEFHQANTQALLKGAKNADELIYQNQVFDREQIAIANRRVRTEPKVEVINGKYTIIGIPRIASNDEEVNRLTISDNKTGEEYRVAFDNSAFDLQQIQYLWKAAQTQASVDLTINITRASDGIVKQAYIVEINES